MAVLKRERLAKLQNTWRKDIGAHPVRRAAAVRPELVAAVERSGTARAGERPAAAAPSAPAPKPVATASGYYIEFRAGSIGTYGHSYVVYGANGGKPNYADLHPMGGYAGMAAGHLVPVPANAVWNPDVLKLPIASRYRVALTGEQYRKLLVAVKQVKASSPVWNAVLNNCNHFIGQLAMAVGLKVPTSFQIATCVRAGSERAERRSESPGAKASRLASAGVVDAGQDRGRDRRRPRSLAGTASCERAVIVFDPDRAAG